MLNLQYLLLTSSTAKAILFGIYLKSYKIKYQSITETEPIFLIHFLSDVWKDYESNYGFFGGHVPFAESARDTALRFRLFLFFNGGNVMALRWVRSKGAPLRHCHAARCAFWESAGKGIP